MGAGITLMIVGAVLAFAVRRETPGVDVQTVGVIFLVAGALVIAHARRGTLRRRTVTRVEDPLAAEQPPTHSVDRPDDLRQRDPRRRTVREQVTDRELP